MNTITEWTNALEKIICFELVLIAVTAITLLLGAAIFGAIFLRKKK